MGGGLAAGARRSPSHTTVPVHEKEPDKPAVRDGRSSVYRGSCTYNSPSKFRDAHALERRVATRRLCRYFAGSQRGQHADAPRCASRSASSLAAPSSRDAVGAATGSRSRSRRMGAAAGRGLRSGNLFSSTVWNLVARSGIYPEDRGGHTRRGPRVNGSGRLVSDPSTRPSLLPLAPSTERSWGTRLRHRS